MSLEDDNSTAGALLKEVVGARCLTWYLASDILELWRAALPHDPSTVAGKAAVLAFGALCDELRTGDAGASDWDQAITALEVWRDEIR